MYMYVKASQPALRVTGLSSMDKADVQNVVLDEMVAVGVYDSIAETIDAVQPAVRDYILNNVSQFSADVINHADQNTRAFREAVSEQVEREFGLIN